MRVGFDVSQTGRERAGCVLYAASLARAVAARGRVRLDLYETFGDTYWDPDHARDTVRIPICSSRASMSRFVVRMIDFCSS